MCPYKGIPDCEACTLPDCYATEKEMLRQESLIAKRYREEYREQVKDDFLGGLRVSELADKYRVSTNWITQILRGKGISVKPRKTGGKKG